MAVYFNGMNARERVALTLAIRQFGHRAALGRPTGPALDKHSTGGVGDSVSLPLAAAVAASAVMCR
ncbi:Thymidine phosphorylase OS=Bosea thiooxidans OX=53254 GN=deoA PE=3 SV=1 [Bosea thiooxidans]